MSERPVIRIDELHRIYRRGEHEVRALDGVSMEIMAGEFVMIVGSSGSGKSTLMNILGGLDRPTSGSYELGGQSIGDYDDAAMAHLRGRRIGFVFQQFHLLPHLNLAENIALPLSYSGIDRDERLRRARAIAERFGLANRLDHLPSELSGGQAQRVAIMRALVNNPSVLMLDEPTGALDTHTGREIMDIFHDLNREGLTIIMVTHDKELAQEGTRKISMQDGRIVADDRRQAPAPSEEAPRSASHRLLAQDGGESSGGLGLPDLLRIGMREGLLTHKMRSALTMLGIIIGVAAVIAMSSFSLGSKKKQELQIRALGANLVNVIDRRLENDALTEARQRGSQGLAREDLHALRRLVPAAGMLAGTRKEPLQVHIGPVEVSADVQGVIGDYLAINNIALADGRGIDATDQHAGARVAVVGADVAELLGPDPLGGTLRIGSDRYQVVGVLADKDVEVADLEVSSATSHNVAVLVPLSTMLYRTRRQPLRSELDLLQVALQDEDDLQEAGLAIRRTLAARHAGVDDFQIQIPLDLLKQKQQAGRLLDVLTLCVSSIALVVGGIGIMNIMLASVTERLKEIGIRRAVGATQQDVRRQFLAESVILSVTGGFVGVALAVLTVYAVGALLALPPVFSLPTVLVAVGASCGVGLIFGYYPALQASQKDPVEVLRNE